MEKTRNFFAGYGESIFFISKSCVPARSGYNLVLRLFKFVLRLAVPVIGEFS